MSLTTEFVCAVCHDPFAIYRPSLDQIERPICPTCLVSTLDGVKRFFGYDKRQPRIVKPQEGNLND
jgi:DNA-directed RNA polymerase subunit RPC12/RpoP